uniref:Uncharacterized protein n=1 Tax=Mustela putorius furo TaxID=9669 RepID=M3Z809_MUSPF
MQPEAIPNLGPLNPEARAPRPACSNIDLLCAEMASRCGQEAQREAGCPLAISPSPARVLGSHGRQGAGEARGPAAGEMSSGEAWQPLTWATPLDPCSEQALATSPGPTPTLPPRPHPAAPGPSPQDAPGLRQRGWAASSSLQDPLFQGRGSEGWGLGAGAPPKLPPAPRLAVSQPSGTTASHQPLQLLPRARLRTALPPQQNTPTQKREAQTTVFPCSLWLLVTQEGKSSQKVAPAPLLSFFPNRHQQTPSWMGSSPRRTPKASQGCLLSLSPDPSCLSLGLGGAPSSMGHTGRWASSAPLWTPGQTPGGEAQRTAWPGVGAQSRSPAGAARPPRHGLGVGWGRGVPAARRRAAKPGWGFPVSHVAPDSGSA